MLQQLPRGQQQQCRGTHMQLVTPQAHLWWQALCRCLQSSQGTATSSSL